jgi:hypothetical protein
VSATITDQALAYDYYGREPGGRSTDREHVEQPHITKAPAEPDAPAAQKPQNSSRVSPGAFWRGNRSVQDAPICAVWFARSALGQMESSMRSKKVLAVAAAAALGVATMATSPTAFGQGPMIGPTRPGGPMGPMGPGGPMIGPTRPGRFQ